MEYLTIKSLPSHEISEYGIIRKKDNKKILSQYINDSGYYLISVSIRGVSKPYRVHRLIAETFIPNPNNKPHINHINGIKTDNRIGNLEWVTHKENMQHAFSTGLVSNKGEKNGMNKLSVEQVLKIKEMLKKGISQQKIAKEIGNISRSCILKIHLNKTWTHISAMDAKDLTITQNN